MPTDATDKVRWIDTDVMVADPLTKAMEPNKLLELLETNQWSTEQPIESVQKKRAKQNARRKMMSTYEVITHNATHYEDISTTADVDTSSITRRVTKDLRSGAVIDDDYKYGERDDAYRLRPLPQMADIRTVFYYPDKPPDAAPEVSEDEPSEVND